MLIETDEQYNEILATYKKLPIREKWDALLALGDYDAKEWDKANMPVVSLEEAKMEFQVYRAGKIKVSSHFVFKDKEVSVLLFSNCFPYKIEQGTTHYTLEYYCVSDLFDEIKEGAPIPTYDVIFCRGENNELIIKEVIKF